MTISTEYPFKSSLTCKLTLRAVFRDIVVGAPDTDLFRIPDRCTPFEKMGQVAESHVVK